MWSFLLRVLKQIFMNDTAKTLRDSQLRTCFFMFCQGTSIVSSRRLALDLGCSETQISLTHWDTLGLGCSSTYHVSSGATSRQVDLKSCGRLKAVEWSGLSIDKLKMVVLYQPRAPHHKTPWITSNEVSIHGDVRDLLMTKLSWTCGIFPAVGPCSQTCMLEWKLIIFPHPLPSLPAQAPKLRLVFVLMMFGGDASAGWKLL